MIKKLTIVAILALMSLQADEIDEMVSKITSSRESIIPKKKLISTKSPMPVLVVVDNNASNKKGDGNITLAKPKDDTFNLTAIMNNSAHINNKWVKIGEKIGNYKLVDIMDDSVFLKDENKTKIIFFKKNDNKIKITYR